jgi:predicted nucleic acid-binding protein
MPGKNNQPLIIVDADAIISFVNIDDAHHIRTKQIMQELALTQAHLLYPVTAVCEAVTVLRGRLNKPTEAASIVEKFQKGDFPTQAVDEGVLKEAAALFRPLASKKNTLFDAVVAAIARHLEADAIFSFDKWYGKIGMTITDDLIEQSKKAA